jgi:4-aminobutyrate aminotransferase-like enzyme
VDAAAAREDGPRLDGHHPPTRVRLAEEFTGALVGRRISEAATEETASIYDRLLTLGVIMQPTGDFQNVLKIKPPLCISQESVDYFVDSLERVLATGW